MPRPQYATADRLDWLIRNEVAEYVLDQVRSAHRGGELGADTNIIDMRRDVPAAVHAPGRAATARIWADPPDAANAVTGPPSP